MSRPVPSHFWRQFFNVFINRPFPQTHDLSANQFETFAKKCGIHTTHDGLRFLEERGFLSPIFRTVHNYDDKSGLTYIYFPGTREFSSLARPRKSEQKDSFESRTDHYHSYEIFLLHQLNSLLPTFSAGFWYLTEEKIQSRILKVRDYALRDLEGIARSWTTQRTTTLLLLLLILEQRYRPDVIGTISLIHLHWSPNKHKPATTEAWYSWARRFDAKAVASRFSVTLSDVKRWHQHLSIQATNLDPMEKWYYLVRHVPFAKREELVGSALLAQHYYVAAEMLRRFARDAFDADFPRENLWTHERTWDEYEKRLYGKRFTFRDPQVLQYVVNEYHLNPQPRLKVFVEGSCEKTALEHLANSVGIDLSSEGVEIEDLEGEGNLDAKKLVLYLKDLQRRRVRYLFVIDPHRRAVENVNRLIDRYAKNQPGKRLLEKAQCKIWVKDFERDNFSDCQIVSSVNRTLKGLARCRLTRKHLQREAYRTGRQDLADLVQQAVSPKLRLSKPKLTKQLLDDHVLGKRDILPSCKAPIVDFFFAMIREARMNYLPTMLYPASRSESLTPESQRP